VVIFHNVFDRWFFVWEAFKMGKVLKICCAAIQPSTPISDSTFGWLSTEESIDVLVRAMRANCFQFVCIALAAHNNSQRLKPSPVLSALETIGPLRRIYRQAELQMALVRHAQAGIFRILLRAAYWKLCKWLA